MGTFLYAGQVPHTREATGTTPSSRGEQTVVPIDEDLGDAADGPLRNATVADDAVHARTRGRLLERRGPSGCEVAAIVTAMGSLPARGDARFAATDLAHHESGWAPRWPSR